MVKLHLFTDVPENLKGHWENIKCELDIRWPNLLKVYHMIAEAEGEAIINIFRISHSEYVEVNILPNTMFIRYTKCEADNIKHIVYLGEIEMPNTYTSTVKMREQ